MPPRSSSSYFSKGNKPHLPRTRLFFCDWNRGFAGKLKGLTDPHSCVFSKSSMILPVQEVRCSSQPPLWIPE